jgi:PAS domain S-box-containing protein
MAWSRRPDGFIEFVNRRWLDFTGFSSDQALGWGCLVAFHPDDCGPLAEKWRALVASGQPGEIEARMRRHDGEYRWFLLRAEPVRDEHGRIIRWYGVNIDIEDRKRAESLRAAETPWK